MRAERGGCSTRAGYSLSGRAAVGVRLQAGVTELNDRGLSRYQQRQRGAVRVGERLHPHGMRVRIPPAQTSRTLPLYGGEDRGPGRRSIHAAATCVAV